jgi:hypothetical protein
MSLSEIEPLTVESPGTPGPIGLIARPLTGFRLSLAAVATLVRDTFRQAVASRLMTLAVCLASLGVLACLSVRVDGPKSLHLAGEIELMDGKKQPLTGPGADLGRMTIGFGLVSVGNFRDVESQVHFLEAVIARWAAGVAGTLLLLASTAGFLPDFLKPGSASILLAKPIPRWTLLAGKVVGVLAFVTVLTGGFIFGTWMALGMKTGIWAPGYLLAWPLLVLQFAGLYTASVVAATCTRNATASLFAALGCWIICLGVNSSRDSLKVVEGAPSHPRITRMAIETSYWILPKPLDLSKMLDQAVKASDHFANSADPEEDVTGGRLGIALSLGSSLAFAVVMLGIAAHQLSTTDY